MMYYVQLNTPITRINEGINEMLNKIAQVAKEINTTCSDNIHLERARDQYIIHLQQCQEDHKSLCKLYKSLKIRLDDTFGSLSKNDPSNNFGDISPSMYPNAPNPNPQLGVPTKYEPSFTLCLNPEFDVKTNGKISVKSKFKCLLDGLICSVAYTKDGTAIAFSNGINVFVISSETGQIITQCDVPGVTDKSNAHCRSIAFSPDGNLLAFSGSGNHPYILRLSNKPTSIQTLIGHTKEVSSILFDMTGMTLITGGFDGLIILWDAITGVMIRCINTETTAIVGIAPSRDFSMFAVAFTDGHVRVYSQNFDSPITFSTKQNSLMAVAVSARDGVIATAGQDGAVCLWVIHVVARPHGVLRGHEDFTLAAAFSPGGILVTGSKDQTLRLWDYQSGLELAEVTGHENTIFAVAHHPEKQEFVSVGGDGAVILWEYSMEQ